MKQIAMILFLILLCAEAHSQSEWQVCAPMPTARMDASSAVIADTLYVIGGRQSEGGGTGSEGLVDVVEAYVPSTDEWLIEFPVLPEPAAFQASATVGRRIFLFGGAGAEGRTLNGIWHWQPGEHAWTQAGTLLTRVQGAAAVRMADNSILLIGGLDRYGNYLDQVVRIIPGEDSFDMAPSLRQARAGAKAVLFQGTVVIPGGYFHGLLGSCELLRGIFLGWSIGPDLPNPRGSHLMCTSDEYVFVVGGQGIDGPLAEVLALESTDGQWVPQNPMTIPRSHLAGGNVGHYIVAAGGLTPDGDQAVSSAERIETVSVDAFSSTAPSVEYPTLTIQLWPNPFSARCSIAADLGSPLKWTVGLYTLSGRSVWETFGYSRQVSESIRFERRIPSGQYFVTLRATGRQATVPVSILR